MKFARLNKLFRDAKCWMNLWKKIAILLTLEQAAFENQTNDISNIYILDYWRLQFNYAVAENSNFVTLKHPARPRFLPCAVKLFSCIEIAASDWAVVTFGDLYIRTCFWNLSVIISIASCMAPGNVRTTAIVFFTLITASEDGNMFSYKYSMRKVWLPERNDWQRSRIFLDARATSNKKEMIQRKLSLKRG